LNLKINRMWQLLGNSLSLPVIEQLLHFTRSWSIRTADLNA